MGLLVSMGPLWFMVYSPLQPSQFGSGWGEKPPLAWTALPEGSECWAGDDEGQLSALLHPARPVDPPLQIQ